MAAKMVIKATTLSPSKGLLKLTWVRLYIINPTEIIDSNILKIFIMYKI